MKTDFMQLAVAAAAIGVLWTIWLGVRSGGSVRKFNGAPELRGIMQSIIAAEYEHPGLLYSKNPSDIYAFAGQLAQAGMDFPTQWFIGADEQFQRPSDLPNRILTADVAADGTRSIEPKFFGTPLAFAVAIFPPDTKIFELPASTPLVWTRGLKMDGTWSKTLGTYGDKGGMICFVGGYLEKFKSIDGKLVKFGTNEQTSNILEALPPGSRISEFTPPSPEKAGRPDNAGK